MPRRGFVLASRNAIRKHERHGTDHAKNHTEVTEHPGRTRDLAARQLDSDTADVRWTPADLRATPRRGQGDTGSQPRVVRTGDDSPTRPGRLTPCPCPDPTHRPGHTAGASFFVLRVRRVTGPC